MPLSPSSIAVFGHKNPDTDAIISAIATCEWLRQQNIPALPYRLGELNKETQYLLKLVPEMSLPILITSLPAGTQVALVDHNESQQSIVNLAELTIAYVIDHHKLGDLQTTEPAFIHLRPVGSCSTIIFTLLAQEKCNLSSQLALLMAGAIISDTLNLTSPTTTDTDRHALLTLATVANITDISAFASALFMAKSDVSDVTDIDLITSDYKQFIFKQFNFKQFGSQNGGGMAKWGIAVIETVAPSQIFDRMVGLQQANKQVKNRDKLDYFLVIVVDILQQQSWAIAGEIEQNAIIEKAFESTTVDDKIALGNRVSRKKQFVPALEIFYKSNEE